MKEVGNMGIINILALSEKEIETIKILLEYAEKKGRNPEMRIICTRLLEKIKLKYYFSPAEEGKLRGLSERGRLLYYEFYERYDFDLIDYIGRIAEERRSPNDIYKEAVGRFPIAKLLFRRYPEEIQEVILSVLRGE